MSEPKKAYSPSEVAERLDRHTESIRRNCRTGDVQAMKLGREWKITPAALREWMGPDAFALYFPEHTDDK